MTWHLRRHREGAHRGETTCRRANPSLIHDDSGNENERIDLNGYTEAKLERLLQSKGVKKRM